MRSPRNRPAQQHGPCRHGELEREHGAQAAAAGGWSPTDIARRNGCCCAAHAGAGGGGRGRAAARAAIASSAPTISSPTAARTDRISMMPSVADKFADRHRHRRERQQRAGHPEDDAGEWAGWPRRLRPRGCGLRDRRGGGALIVHSASGWFSGRACSKAGSLAQAASTATILGNGRAAPSGAAHWRPAAPGRCRRA